MVSINSLNTNVGKFLGWTAKKMSKGLEKGYREPAKVAALALVTSLVTKDAANCVIYTSQSLNNPRIPEDKRRFVGYMDLINGAINVVGQIGSYLLVEHLLTPKLQGLWSGTIEKRGGNITRTKSLFANDNITNIVAGVIENKKAELEKIENVKVDDLLASVKDISAGLFKKLGREGSKAKDITTGVGIVVSSLATTAFIKRIITPLFATPLAGKLADSVNAKEAAQKDKIALEAAAVASSKYDNNMDTVAFSNVTSKQSA